MRLFKLCFNNRNDYPGDAVVNLAEKSTAFNLMEIKGKVIGNQMLLTV